MVPYQRERERERERLRMFGVLWSRCIDGWNNCGPISKDTRLLDHLLYH